MAASKTRSMSSSSGSVRTTVAGPGGAPEPSGAAGAGTGGGAAVRPRSRKVATPARPACTNRDVRTEDGMCAHHLRATTSARRTKTRYPSGPDGPRTEFRIRPRYPGRTVALTPASWRVFRRRFVVACAAALAMMVASIVILNVKVNETLADTKRIGNLTFPEGPAEGGNYLIIGSDSRSFVTDDAQAKAFGTAAQEGGQRSDTMMVLHVDPEKKTNLLVSFPRDLLVTDPATGRKTQINGLFNNGPQAVIDMLNKDFGVEVHHFVQINFAAFIG